MVKDSRPVFDNAIKRRRMCSKSACAARFTTYEFAFESGDMEAVVRGRSLAAVKVLDALEEALHEARRKMAVLESLFSVKDGGPG